MVTNKRRPKPTAVEVDVTIPDKVVTPTEFAAHLAIMEEMLHDVARSLNAEADSIRVQIRDLWPGSAHARLRVVAGPRGEGQAAPKTIVQAAKRHLRDIGQGKARELHVSTRILQLAKRAASSAKPAVYGFSDGSVRLDKEFRHEAVRALSPTEHRHGSLEGRLRDLSAQGGYRPLRSGLRAGLVTRHREITVPCSVAREVAARVRNAFDRRVRLYGVVAWRGEDPVGIKVDDLKVFEPNASLPNWRDLIGIAKEWGPPLNFEDE